MLNNLEMVEAAGVVLSEVIENMELIDFKIRQKHQKTVLSPPRGT